MVISMTRHSKMMKYTIKAEPFRRRLQKSAELLFPLIVHAFCSIQTLAKTAIESKIRNSWALCSSEK